MKATYAQKVALRNQGMTYQQIADVLGISKQAVGNSLSRYDYRRFKYIQPEACVYEGLRVWMNEHHVNVSELVRRLGLQTAPANITRYRQILSGNYELRKATIDKILEITGLTYEQAFENGMRSNWVSVEERMPQTVDIGGVGVSEVVLVCDNSNHFGFGVVVKSEAGEESWYVNGAEPKKICFWLALPQAPIGGK